ncbi:MAG: hypothetical protein B6D54_04565 [Epsilonproteobacteria bacterium 4484_65]|nr:MAG: hypothetical protein B6D54_04565 [Epsilonproteobacteria bacterium 4484_65]
MHILLININPVVSRLISFCMRNDNMNLEEVHDVGDVARDRYDIIFVDEASYGDETEALLANLIMRKKVFLSSSDEAGDVLRLFDTVIKKPFLPSQITAVLENLEEDDTLDVFTEMPSIFPLSSDEVRGEEVEDSVDEMLEEEEKEGISVLDSNEIEKIKALLEMEEEVEAVSDEEYESRKVEVIKQQLIADGLEIVDEDEYVEALSKKPLAGKDEKSSEKSDNAAGTRTKKIKSPKNENKKNQSKKSKKDKKKEVEVFTFEEALLAAIEGMKVKKIKKLLKGAEITIKINFKDKK